MGDDPNEPADKKFQCNFQSAPDPERLVNVASAALCRRTNRATGELLWTDHPPQQRVDEQNSYFVFAKCTYEPQLGASLSAGLNAIGEGSTGTRFVAVFSDSMRWTVPTAEMIVDAAMQDIAHGIESKFAGSDGWRMLQGNWHNPHNFTAEPVAVVQAQPAGAADDDLPEGLLDSPSDLTFRNLLPGIDAEQVIVLLGSALAAKWTLERSVYDAELTLLARNRLWPEQTLAIAASCAPVSGGTMLTIRFGDLGRWASADAQAALDDSMSAVTASLRTLVAGLTLERTVQS